MRQAFGHVALALAVSLIAGSASAQNATEGDMRLRIIVGGVELIATLEDNVTSRDLIAQLPLQLHMADYNSAEKVAQLPKRLSTAGAPEGADPNIGDVAYYAPWGNLVFYYGDVHYWPGIVPIGRIEGNIEHLAGPDAVDVRIERLVPSK